MKNKIAPLLLALSLALTAAAQDKGTLVDVNVERGDEQNQLIMAQTPNSSPANNTDLKTDEQKSLYALGAMLGRNLANFSLSAEDLKFVAQGLRDQTLGRKLQLEPEAYNAKVQELMQARQTAKSGQEKKRSEKFLEEMAKQKGAVKTASGLVYIPLKEGAGKSPEAADKVKVHYHGTLIDGKVFDSSVQRGQPAEFPLNRVIPCWTEGVRKMKVGGKAKLICPSDIAYGDRGSPPTIGPGATLIFDVELLDIVKS